MVGDEAVSVWTVGLLKKHAVPVADTGVLILDGEMCAGHELLPECYTDIPWSGTDWWTLTHPLLVTPLNPILIASQGEHFSLYSLCLVENEGPKVEIHKWMGPYVKIDSAVFTAGKAPRSQTIEGAPTHRNQVQDCPTSLVRLTVGDDQQSVEEHFQLAMSPTNLQHVGFCTVSGRVLFAEPWVDPPRLVEYIDYLP